MLVGIEETVEMMCFGCGGSIVRGTSKFFLHSRDGSPGLVEAVPSNECSQCGEKFLDASILNRIQCVFESDGDEPRKEIKIPVVTFAS